MVARDEGKYKTENGGGRRNRQRRCGDSGRDGEIGPTKVYNINIESNRGKERKM